VPASSPSWMKSICPSGLHSPGPRDVDRYRGVLLNRPARVDPLDRHAPSLQSRPVRPIWQRGAYAMEELVAELGAAFLCAELGINIEPRADHAQYLAHWPTVLKADKRAIFTAASKAAEASAFLRSAPA
jgi:hypothetical protein